MLLRFYSKGINGKFSEFFDFAQLLNRTMELEQQERDLTKSLSFILQEIEVKLGQFEQGKVVTTDLCGEVLEYERPSHKHTGISEQLGSHATRFVQSVSYFIIFS